MKALKIAIGFYLYKGFYVSAYRGSMQTIWNIYTEQDCTQEYEIGFLTKKDALQCIDNNYATIELKNNLTK